MSCNSPDLDQLALGHLGEELGERRVLDLSDPLAREPQLRADRLEGHRAIVAEAKTHAQDLLFAAFLFPLAALAAAYAMFGQSRLAMMRIDHPLVDHPLVAYQSRRR